MQVFWPSQDLLTAPPFSGGWWGGRGAGRQGWGEAGYWFRKLVGLQPGNSPHALPDSSLSSTSEITLTIFLKEKSGNRNTSPKEIFWQRKEQGHTETENFYISTGNEITVLKRYLHPPPCSLQHYSQ